MPPRIVLVSVPSPLVVIPTYLRTDEDLQTTVEAVESVRATAGPSVEVLCVDDGSPEKNLVAQLGEKMSQLQSEVHAKPENSGFAKTVNVGLRRALHAGQDAILMNADVEIQTPGWYTNFRATKDDRGREAAVVGALLLYPDGTIQHAGIYFSLLTRTFDHLYKHGPGNLPEALKTRVAPVTGALQFIRHSTLETVGLYDEGFFLGWEDVDYCIRVGLAGQSCVYNPNIRAYHYEMKFRGRPDPKVAEWQAKSFLRLCEKYQNESFGALVPTIW
jgi:GT2 family glycosyltransferase